MTQEQLIQFFKEKGVGVEKVAEATGYTPLYMTNLLYGYDRMNDRARFRIMQAFPDTAVFLVDATKDNGDEPATDPEPVGG
jgi:cyanate lyase